jgi:hypothetical protein
VDTDSVLTHPDVKCHSNGQRGKRRVWRHLCGVSPNTSLGVYNNNLSVGHRAFLERYFFCSTPGGFKPALGAAENEFRKDVHLQSFWNRVVRTIRGVPVAQLQEVVDSYEGAKREIYRKAMLDYYAYGINVKHSRLKSFVKFEKQDLNKAPRVINPRTPVYNLLLAAYVKFLEKNIFKAINKVYGNHTTHTVIKGLDYKGQASVLKEKWDRFSDPVAVGLDASKFDMHVSKWCLAYEHMFYLGAYTNRTFSKLWLDYKRYLSSKTQNSLRTSYDAIKGNSRPVLKWLLKQQVFNSGKSYFPDGTLSFKMEGTRSSGDINTSLGNCIIMCSLIYGWLARNGVKAELANNGDDCVVIMEKRDLGKFSKGLVEYFAKKGFRMQVEKPVRTLEEVEFCQAHPINLGGEWTMVRNLQSSITKNAMCLVPIQNDKVFRKWLGAVGQCEGSLCSGVPVMQSYASMFRRLGMRASSKFVKEVYRGTTRGVIATNHVRIRSVSDEARASFYSAFGVRPDEQIALEKHFENFTFSNIAIPVPCSDAVDKPLFMVPPLMAMVTPLN